MTIRNSTAPKAHSRKPARRKPAPKAPHRRQATALPDLTAILEALFDANALVSVARASLAASDSGDLEETVLQMGVDALRSVYEQLDVAAGELSRFQEKNARGGGAS